jgi:Outer membrane protein beta-barrel domain
MKKKVMILCSSLLCLLVISANAQKSKSSAIIKGGVNFANISMNDDGDVDDAKTLTSFQLGILGDFHLASIFYLQPGLLFTGKGTKAQTGNENDVNWTRATTKPYYLEIPVNLILKTPGTGTRFFAGAGPYLGIGIAGNRKFEGSTVLGDFSTKSKIKWSNDDPTTFNEEEGAGFGVLRRFDYGLNGTLGIETGGMVVAANYGLGLAKLQSGSDSEDGNNNKHRVVSLTLGFKF